MKLYDELVARGLIAQVTNEEEIREMIDNGKATFYIGFDCTADSLTAGHFMALTLMTVSYTHLACHEERSCGKIRVSTWSFSARTFFMASMILASSPPEATLLMGFSASPALADM